MKRISQYRLQLVKYKSYLYEDNVVRSPKDAFQIANSFIGNEYGGVLDRELFGILWLNTKNRVIGIEVISIGTLNASLVHPREVFKSGILHNAASFVCFHNHPSGDPSPSPEDIQMTQRLIQCGDIMAIECLDHVIIGDPAFISLKDRGHI